MFVTVNIIMTGDQSHPLTPTLVLIHSLSETDLYSTRVLRYCPGQDPTKGLTCLQKDGVMSHSLHPRGFTGLVTGRHLTSQLL